MVNICEHEFERECKEHKGYSSIEFDLAAVTGCSIRKNLTTGRFEIFKIATGEVQYSYTNLKDVVRVANELEEADYITIKCGMGCPKDKGCNCEVFIPHTCPVHPEREW